MLGIEHDLAAAGRSRGDAVLDHAQILVAGNAERRLDLAGGGLADQGHDLGAGAQQGGEPGIVGSAPARPSGHAEGAELGPRQLRRPGEEAIVGLVGARPAAFDVVDAQLVEQARDRVLVGSREVDALGLGAIPESGVV